MRKEISLGFCERKYHLGFHDSIQHLADYYGKAKEHTYKDPETNTTKTSKSEAMIDPVGLLVTIFEIALKFAETSP